jgi:Zn-dependent protease with chaperone function
MNELFFPVVGALFVFFVLVPLLTLVASAAVTWLPMGSDRIGGQESPLRFLLVVGPSLGPVIWLVSATVHQSESGTPLAACVVDHLGGELCRDAVLFGLLLFSVLGYGIARRARSEGVVRNTTAPSADTAASARRVHSICQRNPTLVAFERRISVVDAGIAPACTRGLIRPRVEVAASLVAQLDDDELEATLLHEVEHAYALDPLRFFVASVALSINPVGHLLASEFGRYHFAREALCDRRAVQRGANPLALARSIVSVATPSPLPATVPLLGGHGIGGVRLRVQLLLGYSQRPPGPIRRRPPVGVLTTVLALIALSPHLVGAGPLDILHHGIERAALDLLG